MEKQLQVEMQPMQVDDLDEVQRIEWASYTNPWSYKAFLSEILDNDNAHYLVARVDGRIVGYVGVWIIIDEGHITNIAVAPEYRRQGIGRQLLTAITDYAVGRGVEKMTLEVRVSNTQAQALYRQMGYAPVGIRRGYYQDNNEDAIIMWKDLDDYVQNRGISTSHRDQL